ncbi:MAG: hypothetical protein LBH59_11745 [Planctomycetaceae bacterium]|nr:hypothetical protein [Planctomycetaceae bacterium]
MNKRSTLLRLPFSATWILNTEPVWAVGFALEQTLRDATLTVFSYVDFKVASAVLRVSKNLLFKGDWE